VPSFRTLLPSPALPLLSFVFSCPRARRDLHSFPTRRSSDLVSRDSGYALRRSSFSTSLPVSLRTIRCSTGAASFSCSKRKRIFRSEEHTSELQSRENLVCRLLLEKKKEK